MHSPSQNVLIHPIIPLGLVLIPMSLEFDDHHCYKKKHYYIFENQLAITNLGLKRHVPNWMLYVSKGNIFCFLNSSSEILLVILFC